jgi:hypothetical protein
MVVTWAGEVKSRGRNRPRWMRAPAFLSYANAAPQAAHGTMAAGTVAI